MVDWLFAPIDASRAHTVDLGIAWHARLMVLAWGIALPCGVLAARFFKIMPGQDWPAHIDNRAWWHTHLTLQYGGGFLTLIALGLILFGSARSGNAGLHGLFGWSVIALAATQFLGGWLRGSKGGPTDPNPDGSLAGDHYDMSFRRLVFEYVHKSAGYAAILLAACAIATGLWQANAPRWMPILIASWWALLVVLFIVFQRRGMAVDTYQAIWGPDPRHPGNRRTPIGWGIRRRT
ncbi:MAG: cytochrome b561 domain-containing protein [Pseudomonadota bacterium]